MGSDIENSVFNSSSFIRFQSTMHKPSLSIILPVYNESMRIERGVEYALHLKSKLIPHCSVIEIWIVDDGSTDECLELLPDDVNILRKPHKGKGATVRAGLLETSTEWVLFTDIDWSVPVETVYQLILSGLQGHTPIVIASREIDGATRIAEPPWRHIVGKVFNRWVQWMLLAGYMDTQCGCKLLNRNSIDHIVPSMKENGWAFDVELLLLANLHGLAVSEFAVPWVYQPQSKIRVWRDGLQMAQAILRMKRRLNLSNINQK